jgi:hypothetical protein
MADLSRLKLSSNTRATFNALLAEAPKLGLDSEAIVGAGLPGLRALLALKQAAESTSDAKRDEYLAQLQDTLRVLQYRKHPDLVRRLQTRAMALQGRCGDTEVAHVTRGEIVLPTALQTPALLDALRQAAAAAKIPVNRLRVGSGANSLNPRTGVAEFAASPPTNPPHVNSFFDVHRERITALANEMNVPPDFLMGLSAGESNWGRPQGQNNLFGFSVNERPVDYPTPEAAIDAFRKSQWYSRLQGKAEVGDFLNELVSTQDGKKMYNSVRPGGYAPWVQSLIDTVDRRLPIWEQRP